MRAVRVILVVAAVLLAVLIFLPRGGPEVAQGSVLVVELSGRYVEAAEPSFIGRLMGGRPRPFLSLLSQLKKAQLDERLGGVVLRIRRLDIGWAMAQELRLALEDLRAAGRPTLAYLETGGLGANREYYVASAADTLLVSPSTSGPIIGLGAEYLFLGGLWAKLGAGFETVGSGEYKSAAEIIGGTGMSEPHREMAASLMDSTFEQFVAGIAAGRGLPPAAVREAVDRAPVTAEALQELGLIDGVASFDEAVARLDGPQLDSDDYAGVDPRELGWEPEAHYALVYGTGTVMMGRGTHSPSGALVLTSDTVSEALIEAAEDPEIQGIIFRVDSPGGSPLASDIIWRAAERAKQNGKPFIASVSNYAASGGYYVLAGADVVVAPPGSLVGSIGVYAMRPVLGELLERLGIGVETMTRGRYADLLLASKPLSEPGRERLERELATLYDLFVARVSEGRGLSAEQVDAVGRGRVWTGAQAEERGLVDALGGLRAAVSKANEAAGLAPDADAALVPYPPPRSLTEQLFDALQQRVAGLSRPFQLSGLAAQLEALITAHPSGGPLLVPPLVIEIH